MTFEKILATSEDVDLIESLYMRAFPENERYPFSSLLEEDDFTELLSFHEEGRFVGFIALLHVDALYHIVYFAVPEDLRSRGYGSRIIRSVHEIFAGKRFVVDIEQPDDSGDPKDYRQIRKNFYLRNGYQETIKKYIWNKERYEVMIHGGQFDQPEWSHFWNTLYTNKPSIF